MPVEVEARFRAPDAATLARLALIDTLGPAVLGRAMHATEVDRYLDTRDGRIAAARWACRLRTRGSSTRISLKGPPEPGSSGWLHRRPEVEGPASAAIDPPSWPDSGARSLLLELAGDGALEERLRLNQERRERPVTIDGTRVGTLSLDVVAVERGRVESGGFLIIELELAADADAEPQLESLVDALRAAEPALTPEPRTKLELALALVGG